MIEKEYGVRYSVLLKLEYSDPTLYINDNYGSNA